MIKALREHCAAGQAKPRQFHEMINIGGGLVKTYCVAIFGLHFYLYLFLMRLHFLSLIILNK
jgi:hypothetical protein